LFTLDCGARCRACAAQHFMCKHPFNSMCLISAALAQRSALHLV